MKFGICNEIFQGWNLDDAMAFAKAAGYNGIEIAPFTLAKYVSEVSASERQRIRERAARLDLEISGIHWVLVQAEGMYLNHPEAEVRRRTAKYFCELVNFCADLGGKSIVVGSPKQRAVMEGVSVGDAWQWATETFRDAIKRAEERAITLCFEPLAPSETNFVNTAREAIQFTRQFNSPSMKIILDVKAMCSETKPIPQIIRDSWPEFAYFHANDRNLKGPGFGDVDFRPILQALKEVGYNGYASVEVFTFDEGPKVIATRSIDYLKKVWAELA